VYRYELDYETNGHLLLAYTSEGDPIQGDPEEYEGDVVDVFIHNQGCKASLHHSR
jgi:hypothetical protein